MIVKMKIMIITDNKFLFQQIKELVSTPTYEKYTFHFYCSLSNKEFRNDLVDEELKSIDVKKNVGMIINEYQIVISAHCKQLFPDELVNSVRCINIHPGFNPYNRGWFPGVFSIINKLPIGVTIHEIDVYLDHGAIILQEELQIYDWETSFDIYNRIQVLEMDLLQKHLYNIIEGNYNTPPSEEGNINLKKDFDELCEIDLKKQVTYGEVIDYLRAMTHKGYKNAYFYDEYKNKVYVDINLELEKQ